MVKATINQKAATGNGKNGWDICLMQKRIQMNVNDSEGVQAAGEQ